MIPSYPGVTTRLLRQEERLVLSDEDMLPLVIEAKESSDPAFLQQFLATHSDKIQQDIATFGAVLLRGFAISNEPEFEKSVFSLKGLRGISDAFMSEEGRIPVDGVKFVLHTNAVYKTGGTLYLGGFHSENYYSPDVPGYISFCCLKPSQRGGETGLINMTKVYQELPAALKEKLKENTFFVSKWLLADVAKRYQTSEEKIEALCKKFDLPVVGDSPNKFILMYKPSVFRHPVNQTDSLQINLFEIETLNEELRKCFMDDYSGSEWFWHRFVWRLPKSVFHSIELIYIGLASFFYSPKQAFGIFMDKFNFQRACRKSRFSHDETKVGTCFTTEDVKTLARLMRKFYSSCLWEKGDILLIDNKQVMHAGMPGTGPRLIRAIISNPLEITCSRSQAGSIECKDRKSETIGFYATENNLNKDCSSISI